MAKKLYDSHKVGKCPVCKGDVKHMVFDHKNGIYKCLICNDLHAIK